MKLELPIRYLKGVGDQRAETLARVGIHTLFDLLYYFPKDYQIRAFRQIGNLKPGEEALLRAKVLAADQKDGFRGKKVFTAAISDGTGVLYLVFFNQPYLKEVLRTDHQVIVFGKAERYQHQLQMVHPEFEISQPGQRPPFFRRLHPRYRLPEGFSQRAFRRTVWQGLNQALPHLMEAVPFPTRQKLNLGGQRYALQNIHFPAGPTDLKKAREYLIFEEFFLISLSLLKQKGVGQSKTKPARPPLPAADFSVYFQGLLPYRLTESQLTSIQEIITDLAAGRRMERLLLGEVGSGKTVVAAAALLYTSLAGGQSALLAPTEILAEQHYLTLQRIFAKTNQKVGLLVSGLSPDEKQATAAATASGEIAVLVGTHSLLSENVRFASLSLVVIDEEHKFGVDQRKVLGTKGEAANILLVSATPIPRTLALTLYGTIAVSNLTPREQRRVATYLFAPAEREVAYHLFDRYLQTGKKGYVVTSRLKESKKSGLVAAQPLFAELCRRFPHWKPALLHGRQPLMEKEQIIAGFREGRWRVLVATSVVEAGLDIPEADIILVEDGDRFGLAQLHQLRGRIGRHSPEGLCLVISNISEGPAARRLQAFVETPDGGTLSAEDLHLRGEGEVLGTRQHGLPPLRVANLQRDLLLLRQARAVAEEILAADPELKNYPALRERLQIQGIITPPESDKSPGS